MHTLRFSLTCAFILLLFGCSKEAGAPISFYLSDPDQSSAVDIPTTTAALTVSRVEMVVAEPAQRRLSFKLLPADADVFEKLTTDNFGKAIVVVQGTNVLARPKIREPIPARAGIMLLISTNVDFNHTYREVLKLSRE